MKNGIRNLLLLGVLTCFGVSVAWGADAQKKKGQESKAAVKGKAKKQSSAKHAPKKQGQKQEKKIRTPEDFDTF